MLHDIVTYFRVWAQNGHRDVQIQQRFCLRRHSSCIRTTCSDPERVHAWVRIMPGGGKCTHLRGTAVISRQAADT
jgi:hypothetical protein